MAIIFPLVNFIAKIDATKIKPPTTIIAPLVSRKTQRRRASEMDVSGGSTCPPPRAASIIRFAWPVNCSMDGVHGRSKQVAATGKAIHPFVKTLREIYGQMIADAIEMLNIKLRWF